MFEYKFVKVEMKYEFMGRAKPAGDHHEIIQNHALKGWRLVQIFAPSIGSNGMAEFYEIIFERKINNTLGG